MKSTRTDWFYRRAAYPLRDSDPTELQAFWRDPDKFPSAKHDGWRCLGPDNFAGRVTALVRDGKHLYAGTAAGGVWKSSNEGQSWASVWPANLSQNIGALGLDPARPGYLVCGTGEGNLTTATYPGSGIYCSEDDGATWSPWLSATVTHGFAADQIPRRIASLAVATRSDGKPIIAFGAVSKEENHPAGLFVQKDTMIYGGAETQRDRFTTRWGDRSYNCHSVVFHPTNPDILYVAIEPRGTQNGVWRTTDNGITWEHLNPRGLPAGERCGRISLAISPSHPDHLYALVADVYGRFNGVYRTADGGETWLKNARTAVIAGESDLRSNSVIAVHPHDPNVVLFGATGLYISRDGGLDWTKLTTPDLVSGHHALLLSGPAHEPVIFSGNDAGVAASRDGGRTWKYRSRNLVSAMFYNLSVSPVNSQLYGGGAQDIGALIRSGSSGDFTRAFKGDGGLLVFDPVNPHAAYGTNATGRVYRHESGDFKKGWKFSTPRLSTPEKKLRAVFPLAIRPAKGKRPQQRWLATNRLWFTPDGRRAFRPASRYLDNSAISTMVFSPSDQDTILAGTTNGGVYRMTAIEEFWFWSSNLAGPLIPARLITQIRFHPAEPDTVVLCVGASSAPAANLSGNPSPFSHVFLSKDRGTTWQDIDGGKLPNVAYNAIVYETHPPYRLFVGGDLGVWAYDHGRWINISGNLPNVIISDLDYHAGDRVLTAATFGRGLWRLPLPAAVAFSSTLTPAGAPTPSTTESAPAPRPTRGSEPKPPRKSSRKRPPAANPSPVSGKPSAASASKPPRKSAPKPAPTTGKSTAKPAPAPKQAPKSARKPPAPASKPPRKSTPKPAPTTRKSPAKPAPAPKQAPKSAGKPAAPAVKPAPATKSAVSASKPPRKSTPKPAPATGKPPSKPAPAPKQAPKSAGKPAAPAVKPAPATKSAVSASKPPRKSTPKPATTTGKPTAKPAPASKQPAANPQSTPAQKQTPKSAPKRSTSAGSPAPKPKSTAGRLASKLSPSAEKSAATRRSAAAPTSTKSASAGKPATAGAKTLPRSPGRKKSGRRSPSRGTRD